MEALHEPHQTSLGSGLETHALEEQLSSSPPWAALPLEVRFQSSLDTSLPPVSMN